MIIAYKIFLLLLPLLLLLFGLECRKHPSNELTSVENESFKDNSHDKVDRGQPVGADKASDSQETEISGSQETEIKDRYTRLNYSIEKENSKDTNQSRNSSTINDNDNESSNSNSEHSSPSNEDHDPDQDSFLIKYYQLYSGTFFKMRKGLFLLFLLLVIFYSFFLLFKISSDHLGKALVHLSESLYLSPDLAGMTFLAFGNGAPDLFTAIIGAAGSPEMILGSSVGAGLFILTIVFGFVIIFAGRKQKSMSDEEIKGLKISYKIPKTTFRVGNFWRNILMYLCCVLSLFFFCFSGKIKFWQTVALLTSYSVYLVLSIISHYLKLNAGAKARPNKVPKEPLDGDLDNNTSTIKFERQESMNFLEFECKVHELEKMPIFQRFFACAKIASRWEDRSSLSKMGFIVVSSFQFPLWLTIFPLPQLIQSSTEISCAKVILNKLLLKINPFFSLPLVSFVCFRGSLLRLLRVSYGKVLIFYFLASGLSSLAFSVLAKPLTKPSTYSRWKKIPFILLVFGSFSMSVMWIFIASSELISALHAAEIIFKYSKTLMGMIVLGWGNSFGDLIADVALAQNGAIETALTAVFSGPIQNVLLTLGLGFLITCLARPSHIIQLPALQDDIFIAMFFLISVLLICIILIPFKFSYTIPRWFGFALVAIYLVYFVLVSTVGMTRGYTQ